MKRLLIAVLAGALVAAIAVSAATLDVNGGVIQAGSDFALTCDADGVAVAGWGLETDNGLVYFVRIGGVDDVNCEGADLFVRVDDNGGTTIANSGAVPIVLGTTLYKINFTPVPAQNIGALHVWIEGATP